MTESTSSKPAAPAVASASASTGEVTHAAAAAAAAAVANADEIQCQSNNSKDVEKGGEGAGSGGGGGGGGGSAGRRSRSRRKHRPLLRRLLHYIQSTWIGGKFNPNADTELEELESTPRYRPDSLKALSTATRFSEAEIKHIYRGFKAECPSGIVKEDKFKHIYAQFFPAGANPGLYAHYVFNTFDKEHTGNLSFENFIQGLSILSRGTLEEKLLWTFSLYDINGDGRITKEEMTDIVTAIYELMGKSPSDPPPKKGETPEKNEPSAAAEEKIKEKVEIIFQKMDQNRDGVVTREEFLECCRRDHNISSSMAVFDSTI